MLAFCKRLSLVLSAALGLAVASGAAHAQTSPQTDNFDVLITINAACTITTAVADLNFGTETLLATDVDNQTTFDVQCSTGAAYSMDLNGGSNLSAGTRRMRLGATGNYISYDLYSDSGRTTLWGTAVTGGSVVTPAGGGTGTAVTHTIYGRVPGVATAPAPGSYTDTVQLSVTF